MYYVHGLPGAYLFSEFFAKLVDKGLDYGLETSDGCFREEIAESSTSSPMKRMTHGAKRHLSASKHASRPGPFFNVLGHSRIQLIYEIRIRNMKLIGIDTYDRACQAC